VNCKRVGRSEVEALGGVELVIRLEGTGSGWRIAGSASSQHINLWLLCTSRPEDKNPGDSQEWDRVKRQIHCQCL